MAALAEEPQGCEASSPLVRPRRRFSTCNSVSRSAPSPSRVPNLAGSGHCAMDCRSTFTALEASVLCNHCSSLEGGNTKEAFVLSVFCTSDFKGINSCYYMSSVVGVLVSAVCSCGVPGGGRRLGGLSLDLSLLLELLPQGCLHLSRNVWRCLADLHGRFLELDRVPAVHLRFQRVLLLHLPRFAVCGRQGVGRERFGETHAEAIFHVS